MTHTPGPWEIDDDTLDVIALTIGDAPAYIACQPTSPTGRSLAEEEIRANLRLIAAAPDLLAAAKLVLEAGDQEYVKFIVRDAISKAEGRE
jgi:histidinol-phosphate/aromatic aminotransferase/cobyric acid decarboxylase-like protein